jgi:O-antigen/teichoic acid export membrane protein
MSSLSRISLATLVVSGARNALSIATSIMLARAFGPGGKGIITGLETLRAGIASLTAGVATALTYSLTKERRTMSDLLPGLALITLVVSIAAIGFVAIGALRYGWTPVTAVYAATVPASVILSWQSGVYLGLNRVNRLNAQTLGLGFGFLIAVALTGYALRSTPIMALLAWSLAIDVAAIVMLVQIVPSARGGRNDPGDARRLASMGVRWGLYSVAGFLVYRIDSLMVGAMLGAAAFGIYSLAVSAGELLFMISRSVATASAYRIGAAGAQESADTTAAGIRISTPWVAAAAVASYVAVPFVVDILYGKAFDAAVQPIRILLPGIVAYSSAGIFSQYFNLQMGRPIFMLLANVVLLVVQGGACLYLIPRFGLDGAAAASSLAYIISAIAATVYFCSKTGVRPAAVWVPRGSDLLLAWRALLP